jgi:O-antigen/teichoic acid export membrane protein
MSRLRRAVHGVVSSYVLLGAAAIYSLASVPVALHYLDAKRFGLWAVMGTLSGYLSLIDAGMTSAAARLVVDYKDDRNGGCYGGFIKSGWLVFSLQGAVIFGIGLSLAGVFARLLAIEPDLQTEFIRLVNWQCGCLTLLFATRIWSLILNANQRMDLSNYAGVGGFAINFSAQWIFFHYGFGVLSLALGAITSAVFTSSFQAGACARLRLLPDAGHWGSVSRRYFLEIAGYGKDLFLVSVGTQLIMASQTIVVTRMLGLEAVAMWNVGLRVFSLLNQLIWRVADMSASAFAEMLARGEITRLRDRYQTISTLSLSLSAVVAVSYALCNSQFILIWTHGRFHWPALNDCLLALWTIILAAVHCHSGFVMVTKQIGFMRYIYFAEGLVFIAVSFLVARAGGLAAIIGSSVVCSLLFSGAYCTWRVQKFFNLQIREVVIGWAQPAFHILCLFVPLAAIAAFLGQYVASNTVRLAIWFAVATIAGTLLFLRFGIPKSLAEELLRRAPRALTPALNQVLKLC